MTPSTEQRELIVIVEPAAAPGLELLPTAAPQIDAMSKEVAANGGILRPGFRRPLVSNPEQFSSVDALPGLSEASESNPDLSAFFRIEADDDRLEELAEVVRQNPIVAAAYIQPATELPILNNMLPSSNTPPSHSLDFTRRQIYLNASPDGVDAVYAWAQSGGTGSGVQVVDIEWAWNLTHEDLVHHQAPIFAGAPRDGTKGGRNHGTAVLGVTSAGSNGFGVTGICPDATVRTITNIGGITDAEAIQMAADMLEPGDVLILEMHRPGPRHAFANRADQLGFIAIEWWPYDLAAIQYAVSRGIVVVEAAGNGAEDLDDTLYNTNPGGTFPSSWHNPFSRTLQDSGAILVGAGAPPPGTHGKNHGPARSRLDFSNYGALLDAQGWGREVTTCGYGDLQGGFDENLWYTDQFSGTSSATPIVAGALVCVQGARKANGKTPLTPAQLRYLLRQPATGAPQQNGLPNPATGLIKNPATQRIGSLPDLKTLIAEALLLP